MRRGNDRERITYAILASTEDLHEQVVVVDSSGAEWKLPVPNAAMFMQMLMDGGSDPGNFWESTTGALVRQSSFVSVRVP